MNIICLVQINKGGWILTDRQGNALTSEVRWESEWKALEWAKAWHSSFSGLFLIHIEDKTEEQC
jgi:hypothetical protein